MRINREKTITKTSIDAGGGAGDGKARIGRLDERMKQTDAVTKFNQILVNEKTTNQ